MSFNVSHFCGYLSYQRARKLLSGKENPGAVMRLKTMIDQLCAAVACWGGRCCSVQWLSRRLAIVAPMTALSWVFSLLQCFCLL